jgi:glycosyltransferase involved in cell wall biosynthesis
MRVAFISTVHGHGWPGSEYLWAETAERLLDRGDQVFSRCSRDFSSADALNKLIARGLVYDAFDGRSTRLSRLKEKLVDPLGRLRRWGPDLVVVSAGSAFDIAYSPSLARFLTDSGIPFIPVCHFNAETFWVDEGNRETMRRVYSAAKHSVFVSEDNHRITERQLALKIEKYSVIRPPFPLRLNEPLPWPEVKNDEWSFACVARLESRWKGQDVLLEVFAEPQWKGRRWKLNLYGEGGERDYLENLAAHFGIANQVCFCGFVHDRSEIWRNNHIQIFPTRGEGGPMVLTEGMACGRLAVITDCGNAREYVEDGVDGFLAAFATPEIFADALERAWERRHEWENMGILAHGKIARLGDFDPAKNLIELLDEVDCSTSA